jgi:hypothetical protein
MLGAENPATHLGSRSENEVLGVRRPTFVLVLLSAWVISGPAAVTAQVPVGESALDFDSVARVAQDLETLIVEAVDRGGGDLEFSQAHWVFLFSTGHFPGEPIRAQAARETAVQLLRRLAVPGDLVSAFAFEMDLWEHGDGAGSPLELPSGPQAFESVARMFPLTAQSGSVGGHDTERALVEVANRVGAANGPIVIVFTNSAASITTDPAGRPLMGEDDAAYRSLLSTWSRAPAINRSGASYEATYEVTRSNGEIVTNTLDVVLLTPQVFVSAPTTAARAALRQGFLEPAPVLVSPEPAPVAPEPEPAPTPRGFPWFLVALLMVAGGGVLVYLLRTGKIRVGGSAKVVTVQGATLSLADVREGAVVGRVVPRGYQDDPASSDRGPTVVHPDAPFGDEPLGRVMWTRGGLIWKDAAYQATRWLDQTVRSPVALGGRGGSLELEGVVRERPGMPPRTVRVRVEIEMGATP